MKRLLFSSVPWKGALTSASYYHKGPHFELEEGKITGVVDDVEFLYEQLEQRLDLSLLPYPKTDEFYELMRLVFRPEDIPFLTHIRTGPTEVSELAERVGISYEEADERLREMSFRGVISWFVVNGHELVVLPDYVVGWYEFTFIWLSHQGMLEDYENYAGEKFDNLNKIMANYLRMYAPAVIQEGNTSVLRATPLDLEPKKDQTVLTYETMKDIFENSRRISVVNCPCKFHETYATGVPLPDDIPLRCCYQIDEAADSVIEVGIGWEVSKDDIYDDLDHLRDTGHMFNAENNKEAQFFCSCHKEWCGVRKVFEDCGFYPSHRSGFIPLFDEESCIGCAACVDRCPVDVLELFEVEVTQESEETKKKKRKKVRMIDGGLDVCVGCLNCWGGCKFDAIDYTRRDEDDTYQIPTDVFEWSVRMAYERGRLHNVIFDDPQSPVHDVLRKIGNVVENNPISNVIKKNKVFHEFFCKTAGKIGRKDFLKSVDLKDE